MRKRPIFFSSQVETPQSLLSVPGARKRGPPYNMTRLLLSEGVTLPGIQAVPQVLPDDWTGEHVKSTLKGQPLDVAMREYQTDFLRVCLWFNSVWMKWATGSGKTKAALWWAFAAPTGVRRAVILAPKRVRAQWAAEIRSTLNGKTVYVVTGKTRMPIPSGVDIVIVNWEIIIDRVNDCLAWAMQDRERTALIVDESHWMADHRRVTRALDEEGNQVWRPAETWSASAARLAAGACRRVALTATPYSSSIGDYWSQWDMLEPGAVGKSRAFVDRYTGAKAGKFGGLDTTGKTNIDELRMRLSMIMHVVSKERMQKSLPPLTYEQVRLPVDQQDTPTAPTMAFLRKRAAEGADSFFEAKVMLAAERKRSWLVDNAIAYAREGFKVVIFTGRKVEVDLIASAVRKQLRKETDKILVLASHGDTATSEREAQRVQYSTRQSHAILIGTHDAWGESIDGLQTTDIALLGMLPWTPLKLVQTVGRFQRLGQDRPVRIVFPIAEGTVDVQVSETLIDRFETVTLTLEGEEESVATAAALAHRDESLLTSLLDAFLEEESEAEVEQEKFAD